MPREISDTSIELFTTLLNEKIALIESYAIPIGDKKFLKASYEKALEEIKNNNTSAAAELERIKKAREDRRKEEEERNRTHIIANPVPTETIKEGNNLIVKPKEISHPKPIYTQDQLECRWKGQHSDKRTDIVQILLKAYKYPRQIECYEKIYPNEENSNKYIMFSQLIHKLHDYGYLIVKREGQNNWLSLTDLGKACIDFLQRTGIQ